MEAAYSITVHNKFSLALDEDEDPLEVLKVREQEREAKKKEKLSEKENKSKQPEVQKNAGTKPPKTRVIKDAQQPPAKIQEPKKDQAEKKPAQSRSTGGERNVKFPGESREERNNRRNREDGERPPRNQMENRRGPPGEISALVKKCQGGQKYTGKTKFRDVIDSEGRDFREPREHRDPPQEFSVSRRESRGSGDNNRPEFGGRGTRGGPRSVGGAPAVGGGGMRSGRGGPRGGRSGFDLRGKREFDRQSGSDKTGVKPVDKKDGAGSHNWGTHNDEIEESLNPETSDWDTEKPEIDLSTPAVEGKEGEPTNTSTEEKPVEEESREITLDEWKAKQGSRAKPQYNLRKAGEGEDLTRWKKMYALEKKKEGEEEDEDEEDYDVTTEYPQRVGRQKRVFDIDIQFSDSRRGGSSRGGRGGRGGRGDRPNGGRGFGNRGGPPRDAAEPRGPPIEDALKLQAVVPEQRSPRGRQNAPKVDDEHDFPSLG